MVLSITMIIAFIFVIIALSTKEEKTTKVVRYLRYLIGIIGLIYVIYIMTCGFRSTPYIEDNIQTYSVEKIWVRGKPQYFVVYIVDNNAELVNVTELDINYNSDKNAIQVYKKDLPDFLLDDNSALKAVIYTTDSPDNEESDMLKSLKK